MLGRGVVEVRRRRWLREVVVAIGDHRVLVSSLGARPLLEHRRHCKRHECLLRDRGLYLLGERLSKGHGGQPLQV